MDKTEKYNIASIDIHGHGCDVTELKHVLPPEEFAIETAREKNYLTKLVQV
jgi:ArsR family transcriptional regulator, lead/cadmium/zinc/bismuth-responsive transcriptional repressor